MLDLNGHLAIPSKVPETPWDEPLELPPKWEVDDMERMERMDTGRNVSRNMEF